jgi:hypothetical protein
LEPVPCTAPHEEKAARASSGEVFLLPVRISQAGRTEQLALELSRRERKRCSRARSCISLMPDSGICRWVQ